MASNKNMVIFSLDWLHELQNDIIDNYSPEEIAYLLYAAAIYSDRKEGEEGFRIDIGDTFGDKYKELNRTFNGYAGQIDRIKNYDPAGDGVDNSKARFDSEKIRDLAAQGVPAKEVCIQLGYGIERAKSITSNRGWMEGRKLWKARQKNTENNSVSVSVQKNTENTDSVQKNTENNLSGFDF